MLTFIFRRAVASQKLALKALSCISFETLHSSRRTFMTSVCRLAAAPGAPPNFLRDKPHLNIGTVGQLYHGKTTLTAAITKVLSEHTHTVFRGYEDIIKEERDLGTPGLVEYETDKRHYGHVDCPGHVCHLTPGTAAMDGCILVVAATDGTRRFTRGNLLLTKQIGIQKLVVFINKADAADKEMLKLMKTEVRELLTEFGYDGENTPVITGSALCALEGRDPEIGAERVKELLKAVDTYIPLPVRDLDKPFYMFLQDIFSIPACGMAVAGKLERGIIKKGDDCEIIGFSKQWKTTITSIEMFKKNLDHAEAGDQLSALVRGISRGELRRGMVLGKPGTLSMHNHFEAQIYLLSKEEGSSHIKLVFPYFEAQMVCGTWDVTTLLEIPDKHMIMCGEDARVIMNLRDKMVMEKGFHFTLRDGGGTLGYGVITNLLPDCNFEELEQRRTKNARAKQRSQQQK